MNLPQNNRLKLRLIQKLLLISIHQLLGPRLLSPRKKHLKRRLIRKRQLHNRIEGKIVLVADQHRRRETVVLAGGGACKVETSVREREVGACELLDEWQVHGFVVGFEFGGGGARFAGYVEEGFEDHFGGGFGLVSGLGR